MKKKKKKLAKRCLKSSREGFVQFCYDFWRISPWVFVISFLFILLYVFIGDLKIALHYLVFLLSFR